MCDGCSINKQQQDSVWNEKTWVRDPVLPSASWVALGKPATCLSMITPIFRLCYHKVVEGWMWRCFVKPGEDGGIAIARIDAGVLGKHFLSFVGFTGT